jgi:hypothetical protein
MPTVDRQAVISKLSEAGCTDISVEWPYVNYTCPRGHIRRQYGYDISKGRGCIRCSRAGRAPRKPTSVPVGTQNGDLVVVEELGVIDGFSRVRVRNTVSGLEATMLPGEFKRQKRKLLSVEQRRAISRRCGLSRKGKSNPKNARYSFADVLAMCEHQNVTLLHPVDSGGMVYASKDQWHVRCHCGRIFTPNLNNILNGIKSCGCIKSQPQFDIADWIRQDLGIRNVQTNVRGVIDGRLELDIYLPDHKLAIEYCGLFWHGELLNPDDGRTKHLDKARKCHEKGIRLITIFESEWLEKEGAVKAYIRAILGGNRIKINARACTVSSVSLNAVRGFLEEHHLQGASGGIAYALTEPTIGIVAVAVFARPNASRARSGASGDTYELSRYCVKGGCSVRGGLGKLIAAFKREHTEIKTLISYSDNRWSSGNLYTTLGFIKQAEGKPSYWYFKQHTQGPLEHRYRWRKSEAAKVWGSGPGDTEWDIMRRAGYDRIWDCGSARWVLDLT